MPYFRKGVGLIRVPYKTNLQARSANLDFVAGKYLIQPAVSGVDVITSVTVNDESIGKALITNPASLTEVHLPAEYDSISPKAFDGCSNLESIYIYAGQVIPISEDAIPSGCTVYVDYEFLADYQAEHQTLTFAGFDSGYTYTIPYVEGVTPTTLTAQYVEDCVASLGDAKNDVGKVVVPLYFTAYESGSIQAVENAFTNWQHLVTCYEAGNVDIEKNGDVYAKILSLNKTLDQALVYARTFKLQKHENDSSLIIVPPSVSSGATNANDFFNGCANLVYMGKLQFTRSSNDFSMYRFFGNCPNLVKVDEVSVTGVVTSFYSFIWDNLQSITEAHFKFLNGTNVWNTSTYISFPTSVTNLTLDGLQNTFTAKGNMSHDDLVRLLDGLGEARTGTQQYAKIGPTNLAKLTAEEIAIATAKNWVVQ